MAIYLMIGFAEVAFIYIERAIRFKIDLSDIFNNKYTKKFIARVVFSMFVEYVINALTWPIVIAWEIMDVFKS